MSSLNRKHGHEDKGKDLANEVEMIEEGELVKEGERQSKHSKVDFRMALHNINKYQTIDFKAVDSSQVNKVLDDLKGINIQYEVSQVMLNGFMKVMSCCQQWTQIKSPKLVSSLSSDTAAWASSAPNIPTTIIVNIKPVPPQVKPSKLRALVHKLCGVNLLNLEFVHHEGTYQGFVKGVVAMEQDLLTLIEHTKVKLFLR